MNRILETTKYVVGNSEFVKINKKALVEFSDNFKYDKTKHWLKTAPFDFFKLTDEEKLSSIFILNSISFCYWGEPKWTVQFNSQAYDGAYGLIAALQRALVDKIPLLDLQYLVNLTKSDLAKILKGNVEIPLLDQRLAIIKEISFTLLNRYQGKVSNILKKANFDCLKLLDVITQNFKSFKDTSTYKDTEIFFQKRAQLFIADIFQLFNGRGSGELKNIDQITACADYKLPLVLRRLGILTYNKDLAAKVDHEIELPHNSAEEVEIRANTIWVIELTKEQVKKRIPNILSLEINDHLWLATQEKLADDKPYHHTKTTAY